MTPERLDALVAALSLRTDHGLPGDDDVVRGLLKSAADAIVALRSDIPYVIADPDYARAFSIARGVAWQYGWAALPHGSFTRDLDVCFVPWEDRNRGVSVDVLFARMTEALEYGWQPLGDKPTAKPAGRLATSYVSRLGWGDTRWLDLSAFPGHPIDLA